MALADRFGFFDPKQPYSVSYGDLPHWDQPGATSFITFRTADSLPASVVNRWLQERDEWLRRHDIVPSSDWRTALRQRPHELQREFHRTFAAKLED